MDKGHILIVDDEEGILTSLEDILEDEGYRVAKAHTGEDAMELVRSEPPDVVLVDVWMPGIDGVKTLQAVKEHNAETEVIVMSGHGNIDTAVAATKLGAFDFIEKPLSMETVLRVVGQAVRSRRLRAPKPPAGEEFVLIGSDEKIAEVRIQIEEAAADLRPMVISGEPGSGKRYVARVIHDRGVTRGEPFTPLHCRALSAENGGAGAAENLARLLPERRGGTIFLDGLAELAAGARIGVLETLLERARRRERLIVAIDESPQEGAGSLPAEIAKYLLARKVRIPPLRERRGDILALAKRFLAEAMQNGGVEKEFEMDALAALFQFDWPGNVAELKSAVNRAVVSTLGKTIQAEHLPDSIRGTYTQEIDPRSPADFKTARRDWERRFFSYHLVRNNWDVEATAREVNIPPATLARKLRSYRLASLAASRKSRADRQRTIGRSLVIYGRGLHSGVKTGLILEPLPPDSGIRFGSLTTSDTVAARPEFVENTNHATNLRDGTVVARTIEHLMSALHAYGISNILVKIGEEVPNMDGSAAEFCRLIEDSGVEEQEAAVAPLVVDKVYEVGGEDDPDGFIRVEPSAGFSISYDLDYPEPIGRQSLNYVHESAEGFGKDIAPARTFSFIWELENLERMGLGEGGRWGNVILVDHGRIVNTELRFPDEFVRHKILDIVGDFYLLGRPLRGKVTAARSGHRLNVAMVRLLSEALL